MTKEEAIELMLNSINSDNRDMCKNAGMDDQETERQIEQSQPALGLILSNMYDKMKDAGIIA